MEDRYQASLMGHAEMAEITYDQTFDNFKNQVKTKSSETTFNLGLSGPIGDGLSSGFLFSSLEREDKSKSLNSGRTVTENFKNKYIFSNLYFELVTSLHLGVFLNILDLNSAIVGSFGIDPRENTTEFKSLILGVGASILYDNGVFLLEAKYLPPSKGKSDILGEEKIIGISGMEGLKIERKLNDQKSVGFLYERMMYKYDELILGTTANDDNNTQIKLLGLNPYVSNLFKRSLIKINFNNSIRDRLHFKSSLTRNNYEWTPNFNELPQKDKNLIHDLELNLGLSFQISSKLTANASASKRMGDDGFKTGGSKHDFKLDSNTYEFGFSSEL